MAWMMVHGHCCACGTLISYNSSQVPSLTINGSREPLCRVCFAKWNEIHRMGKGLKPLPLNPDAYEPEKVS